MGATAAALVRDVRPVPPVPEMRSVTPFTEYMRALMAERSDLTPSKVAAYAGVSRTTVNYWLRGVSRPQPESVEKLATALGVDYTLLRDIVEGRAVDPAAIEDASRTIRVDDPKKASWGRQLVDTFTPEELRRLWEMGITAFRHDVRGDMDETNRRLNGTEDAREGSQ